MKVWRALAVGLQIVAVGGCTFDTPWPGAPSPPESALEGGTAAGGALPPPDSPVVPSEGGTEVEAFAGELSGPPASVRLPAGSAWSRPGAPLTQQQSDLEACYRFATSQIARDARIDEDRLQNRDDGDDVHGVTTFSRRVDFYSERRRRGSLFDSCMHAKGYTKS